MLSPRGTMTARADRATGFLTPTPTWQGGLRGWLWVGRAAPRRYLLPTRASPVHLARTPSSVSRRGWCQLWTVPGQDCPSGAALFRGLARQGLPRLPICECKIIRCACFTKSGGGEPRPTPGGSVGTEAGCDALMDHRLVLTGRALTAATLTEHTVGVSCPSEHITGADPSSNPSRLAYRMMTRSGQTSGFEPRPACDPGRVT